MPTIFMSYRRVDTAAEAGRIYDRLTARFGRRSVFKDVDDIPVGIDFRTFIADAVARADVVLALIGPRWLDVTDANGNRRLEDPSDFIRAELEAALVAGKPLIPVLVSGATMPSASALPASLSQLAYLNAMVVRADPDFSRDMDRLTATLERFQSSRGKSATTGTPAPRSFPEPFHGPSAVPAPSAPPAATLLVSRVAELRAAHQANLAADRAPYHGVALRTRDEVLWLIRERGWSGEAPPPGLFDLERAEGEMPDGGGRIDLSGADLSRVDLSEMSLYNANFSGATLDGTLLNRALLDRADFSAANLESADLSDATLTAANLTGASIQGTNLSKARLGQANLQGLALRTANLQDADLSEANLKGSDLSGAVVVANLSRALLREADLSGVNCQQAILTGAFLEQAQLKNADFSGLDLRGVNLSAANLEGVNVSSAVLTGARFDSVTALNGIILDSGTRLDGVLWGNGSPVQEKLARTRLGRIRACRDEARVNRQLALILRGQGLLAQSSRYRLREQKMERKALFWEGRLGNWAFSWVLNILAGYGEQPWRTIAAYVLVVLGFALTYFQITHHLATQSSPLSWNEALVLSISSFHGRGFFPSGLSLGDPVAMVAGGEAIIGLFIELIFIATFSRRFLGN